MGDSSNKNKKPVKEKDKAPNGGSPFVPFDRVTQADAIEGDVFDAIERQMKRTKPKGK